MLKRGSLNKEVFMQMIQISRIGKGQLEDVEHSRNELHDKYFRTCTVLQGTPPTSDIGDTIPFHIAKLYGGHWDNWNKHFVVQVAGCSLKCWYCYVDNLKPDRDFIIPELVGKFIEFKEQMPNLNVFHFMGGCPGRYSPLWKDIRRHLDLVGFYDVIFLTDITLNEFDAYGVRPWKDVPDRSLISVCLKGTNFQNFMHNTGVDGFAQAIYELFQYFGNPQVHFSVIGWDPKDRPYIEALLGEPDWMKVKLYHVVKERMKEWKKSKAKGGSIMPKFKKGGMIKNENYL